MREQPAAIVIVSIQAGRTRTMAGGDQRDEDSRSWVSAIVKEVVAGPVRVGRTGLEGDEQADQKHHGGVDKALLGYAASNYVSWRESLPEVPFAPGAFGENVTLSGQDETSCCIGDIYAVGGCRLQVSQPRQPCWKLSRRWNLPELARLTQQTGRTGWYYRVLEEGVIEAGSQCQLVDRPFPELTISWANRVMYAQPHDSAADLRLAGCPALADSWRGVLLKRVVVR